MKTMRKFFLSLFTAGALGSAHGAVWFVSNAGSDLNPGTFWGFEFQHIFKAVSVAMPGDQIWVKRGFYAESPVSLNDGIGLYGGFKGTEISPDERDIAGNPTVIDGTFNQTCVFIAGLSSRTRLDGFILENGQASFGMVASNRTGGGIYSPGTDAQISNCVIRYCAADAPLVGAGGGMFFESGTPTIQRCAVHHNRCTSNGVGPFDAFGGGIGSTAAYPRIYNSLIYQNTASCAGGLSRGGGIGCTDNGPSTANCTIVGNVADDVGGIYSPFQTQHHNNIIAFNKMGGSMIQPGLSSSNLYYNNAGYDAGLGFALGDFVAPPRFVDEVLGDYHITPFAPPMDSGDLAFAIGLLDIDQQARIIGQSIDRGADEVDPERTLVHLNIATEGRPSNGSMTGQPMVEIEIRMPGTLLPVQRVRSNLSLENQVTFPLAVTPGVYDLAVKPEMWLRKVQYSVPIGLLGGPVEHFSFAHRTGDCDNDNCVSIFDYILLSDAFDQAAGDPLYDYRADLDADGVVSVFDYIALSDNFDLCGDD